MKKAVTLIELLVVLGIFSFFIAGILNLFVFSTKIQARVLQNQQLLEQINFVLEYMGREIRMAKKDDVQILNWPPKNCCVASKVNFEVTSSKARLNFRNSRNQCHSFYLSSEQILETIEGSSRPLTATSSVIIKRLQFEVFGAENNSGRQPTVTILIEASPPAEPNLVFRFQTTISQRDLNIEL